MDLLGGYGSSGSDGSDSDDSSVQSDTGPAPPPPAAAAASAGATSAAAAAPLTAPKAHSSGTTSGAGPCASAGGISKKGRRLLSLGAVLPPEIFDRLTREQGGGGGGVGDSSDSDASDYGGNNNNGGDGGSDTEGKKKRSLKRKKGSTSAAATAGSAPGNAGSSAPGEMGDFLRELRSAPSVGPGDDGHKKAASTAAPSTAASKPREEKLGMAFMSVTTTVTSKKDVGVEDIHATRSRPSVGVEAASASAGGNDVKKPSASAAAAAAAAAASAAPAPVPIVSTIRRAAAPVVAVPRPGLSAAPPVQSAPYAPQQQQYHQNQYQYQQQQQQQQYHHQEPAMGAQQSRKKSRKDLERSLRAGNFDALGSDARATTVHQDDLDYGAYAPTEADLSEAAARTAAANAAKAGAAGLRMYDPSAGGDVDVGGEVSQKHRSKHQINQLVAKAAVLEAHRAGGVGPSGQRTVKGSNSRADAKRKYGW